MISWVSDESYHRDPDSGPGRALPPIPISLDIAPMLTCLPYPLGCRQHALLRSHEAWREINQARQTIAQNAPECERLVDVMATEDKREI
jgi:hypothetical protein